ncbi:MAG: DUF885 family protein, partial [Pseudomonadota bacterium]
MHPGNTDSSSGRHACRRPGPGVGRSATLVLAVVLVAAGCGDSDRSPGDAAGLQEAAAADASSRLDSLIERYADARLGERRNAELPDLSADAFLEDIEADRQLLQQVSSIDPEPLSFEARIDRRALIGLLESDVYSAEQRRIWENDAALYVPAGRIGRLLEPEAAEPAAERAGALLAVLRKIPGDLEHARRNLGNPPRRFTEAAIFKTDGTIESLQADVSSLADEAAVASEEFGEALETAVSSLRSLSRKPRY